MPFSTKAGIFTATDEQLIAALEDADLPSLIPALAHLTGDMSLIHREELRPKIHVEGAALAPQGGLSIEEQQLARELAAQSIKMHRNSESASERTDEIDQLRQLIRFITGEVAEDYESLLLHELGLGESTAPPASPVPVDIPEDFSVMIIGAGMSGLLAAHRLHASGIPTIIVERNTDVGGVWLENNYPGCRLDTNNFAYSYSFAQKSDWTHQYSTRDSIYAYFQNAADRFGLYDKILFGTEVVSAKYDETRCRWTVTTRSEDGGEQTYETNAVISAVGQLNQPSIPNFSGKNTFGGASFHTARWDHSVDLSGKRVAVIGTGASSYQVIPEIAERTEHLYVMQRTAPWALPAPAYHEELRPGLKWLFENIPDYHRWFRFNQFWIAVDGMRRFAVVDPAWSRQDSVSQKNYDLRNALEKHISSQYVDRPDLLQKVIPDYPPYSKRMLRDNGGWARTLQKDNVSLIGDKILGITEKGIITENGDELDVNVIIYGTGFKASKFLSPMQIVGRDGVDLREWWGEDPRAFLGITVPGFPNFFCLYGPNTNLVLNGSIIMFSELAMNHVMKCIASLASRERGSLEPKSESFLEYNMRIDRGNEQMAWGIEGVNNWYKSSSGRVSQNWPFSTVEYWRLTKDFREEDYVYATPDGSGQEASDACKEVVA
ncbi:4-hydroxyacetophenone monooxygenase [Arthrobacter sp. SLBN-100]|uniref:flavin-containing monooxygenase n=1 Tax=Arthrobacter sp. SLBN-100 TaxID=2768450 RepID=UPI00114FE11B|nr:NAD(P)/FAD-dependent oxidoreductase [Arthrobacter sp. SLBN-100]TQJ62147.1 4-hydroxyacetophenone monooxygenase [Arthrobacter sp. SLBN-100]